MAIYTLGNVVASSGPQIPQHKVRSFRAGKVSKAVDATIFPNPVAGLNVVWVGFLREARRFRLLGREKAGLSLGNRKQASPGRVSGHLLTGNGRYMDQLEQSLYNAVLAGVSLAGDSFCYATPLACDTTFQRQPWFEVPCCPTTAARFFPSIGRYVYSQSGDGLWVNLYVGSQANAMLANGQKVTLKQSTSYPWEGQVKLQVTAEHPQNFTLHLRVPGWASGSTITLNGKRIDPPSAKGYAQITRNWVAGDVVELTIPLAIEKLEAHPNVLQSRGKIALRRGALIYCLEQPDNKSDLDRAALPLTANLTAHFEPTLLGGVTVITGQGRTQDPGDWTHQLYRPVHPPGGAKPVVIKAIPYCVWGNRGQEKMKVWIATAAP